MVISYIILDGPVNHLFLKDLFDLQNAFNKTFFSFYILSLCHSLFLSSSFSIYHISILHIPHLYLLSTFSLPFLYLYQHLLERYGMTELGMVLSNPIKGKRTKGCVGFPLQGVVRNIISFFVCCFHFCPSLFAIFLILVL